MDDTGDLLQGATEDLDLLAHRERMVGGLLQEGTDGLDLGRLHDGGPTVIKDDPSHAVDLAHEIQGFRFGRTNEDVGDKEGLVDHLDAVGPDLGRAVQRQVALHAALPQTLLDLLFGPRSGVEHIPVLSAGSADAPEFFFSHLS